MSGVRHKSVDATSVDLRGTLIRSVCARLTVAVFACVMATQAGAMSMKEARHLLARTGFDPTFPEIRTLADMHYPGAVEKLLSDMRTTPVTPPPRWVDTPPPDYRKLRKRPREEQTRVRKQLRGWGVELRAWWLNEMLTTPSPLTERMTLFWHNHFTSGLKKVKVPQFLYQQNLKFREFGTTNFGDLLRAMMRDPALLIYLDNHRNRRGKPNENLARELLELFTLGEGHYSERDIRDVARALSGNSVNRKTGEFLFRRGWHDKRAKKVLGQYGKFNADDIAKILLAEPRTAELLSTKLWFEFVGSAPSWETVNTLAEVLRNHDYAIKPWLEAMLLMPEFRHVRNVGTRIKSPIEFVVGLMRVFEVPLSAPRQFAFGLRRLGQDLFEPPNVKGWPGGEHWISADTLLVRQQVVARLLRGVAPTGKFKTMSGDGRKPSRARGNPIVNWLARATPAERKPAALQRLLLAIPPIQAEVRSTGTPHDYVEALLLDPAYQLN